MSTRQDSKLPSQPNQSVASALECLLHITSAGQPVGSRELARSLKMEHTKANRMLGTLAGLGLAEKTPDRKYIPGPGIHVLAAMSLSGSNLLAAALSPIERLRKDTGMLVALGVLWRDHVCYLYHGAPRKPLQAAISGHQLYPARKSSIGMLLLSQHDNREVRARLPDATPALLKKLATIREQNHALLDTQNPSMAVGISSPAIAGLALSGRITGRDRAALLTMLQATAEEIESNINEGVPE